MSGHSPDRAVRGVPDVPPDLTPTHQSIPVAKGTVG
jgi:hypothetical protein